MNMFSKISGIYFLLTCSLIITSCKKDESTDPVVEEEIPNETSVLVVNALSDHAGNVTFHLDGSSLTSLGATAYSEYIEVAEGSHSFKYNDGAADHEFPVSFDKDKRYTLLVYGTLANPSFALVKDSLPVISAETRFSFRYINLFKAADTEVDSISLQYYYPSYAMWAGTAGMHQDIKFGTAGAFAEYTAGVDVDWRAIESGSETSSQVVSGVTYKIGSTNVLYTPANKLKGTAKKHHTYIVWASGESKNNIVITHEDEL